MLEPMIGPRFGEKKMMAGFSGLVAQPISPDFKHGFTLLEMRVVEGETWC